MLYKNYHKIWNKYHPEDPKIPYDGCVIHHIDGNHNNNNPNNLQKMTNREHSKLHTSSNFKGERNIIYKKHHRIWNKHHPEDPKIVGDNFVIHHIDGNHNNNNPNNLQKMTVRDHVTLHHEKDKHWWFGKHHSDETKQKMSEMRKGEKSYWFGKHHSKETKQKISENQRGEKSYWFGKRSPRAKYVMVEFQIFSSITHARQTFGVSKSYIMYRMLKNEPGYLYLT